MNLDLFSYPAHPGYRDHATSLAAARSMATKAPTLRQRCLAVLDHGPATPDEIAAELGETVLAVRPRTTELLRASLIEWTGAVRPNASGRMAKVYRRVRA